MEKRIDIHKKVRDFIVDLERSKTLKNKGKILIDGFKTKKIFDNNKPKLNVDGTISYAKRTRSLYENIWGTASSRMYNELGIATPMVCSVKEIFNKSTWLASQDVEKLTDKEIYVTQASNTPFYTFHSKDWWNPWYSPDKWDVLNNDKAREELLELMTEECLDQLTTILMLDEIRMDPDRHWDNMFLYKTQGAEKFEGIIPIDLEYTDILFYERRDFERSAEWAYPAYGHRETQERHLNYHDRMLRLQGLIQDGKFNNQQLETLKRAINYNMPESVRAIAQKHKFTEQADRAYNNTARLWEYNQNHLSKEL